MRLPSRRNNPKFKRPRFSLGLFLLVLTLALILGGCTLSSEDIEFRRAQESAASGDNVAALEHYRTIVDRYVKTPLALKSAQEAARISHYELKKFPEAIRFYKHVILYAPSEPQRIDAQKKIADLYFSQTLDYTGAIAEYSRLLELSHSAKEDGEYRFAIARSYFYQNNFFQSQVEIDRILSENERRPANKDLVFDAMLLKANIFLTTKKLDDAISVLKDITQKFPDRAKAETIGLVLAICYEEKKDFSKAVETLESIKNDYPRKSFIENKIRALKERQSLLPGARGLRK